MNEPNKPDQYKFTPEQAHEIIWGLASTIAPKYAFAYYAKEDLIQEAYIMGMDAYTRYDGKRPLENFIANHMSNRLKTLKRDKYFRPNAGTAETLQLMKKALTCPGNIDKIFKTYDMDYAEELGRAEEIENLNKIIPPSYRKDYLRMLSGARVTQTRRKEIYAIISNNGEENLRG